jgi:hypothetical protein
MGRVVAAAPDVDPNVVEKGLHGSPSDCGS